MVKTFGFVEPLLSAIVVAVISGLFILKNSRRIDEEALKREEMKGAFSRDIEKLKSRLEHEQLVNSTQWAAAFDAYQALWKSLVPLRGLAHKLVTRESELADIGLRNGDVAEQTRVNIRMGLLNRYAKSLGDCMLAINKQAPFYAADIRNATNGVHDSACAIHRRQLAALVSLEKGLSFTETLNAVSGAESREELFALMSGIDKLEGMIRQRRNAIRVID